MYYDGFGQQIQERVLSLATSTVSTARRFSTINDARGLVSTITTWHDPRIGFGNVLNQVQNVPCFRAADTLVSVLYSVKCGHGAQILQVANNVSDSMATSR